MAKLNQKIGDEVDLFSSQIGNIHFNNVSVWQPELFYTGSLFLLFCGVQCDVATFLFDCSYNLPFCCRVEMVT